MQVPLTLTLSRRRRENRMPLPPLPLWEKAGVRGTFFEGITFR
jgi:hypothetical protein